MQTSKELAGRAVKASQAATAVRPEQGDQFAVSLNLAVYHLNTAAKLLREVAEAKATKEGIEV